MATRPHRQRIDSERLDWLAVGGYDRHPVARDGHAIRRGTGRVEQSQAYALLPRCDLCFPWRSHQTYLARGTRLRGAAPLVRLARGLACREHLPFVSTPGHDDRGGR